MQNPQTLWDVLGSIIYILPIILIVWKGGAMANQMKQMQKDIDKNKTDINNVGQKIDVQKDCVTEALQKVADSVSALTNEVGKLSTKIDNLDERMDKLEARVDKIK